MVWLKPEPRSAGLPESILFPLSPYRKPTKTNHICSSAFSPPSVKPRRSDRSWTSSALGQSRVKFDGKSLQGEKLHHSHTKTVQAELNDSIARGIGKESPGAPSCEHKIGGWHVKCLQMYSYSLPFHSTFEITTNKNCPEALPSYQLNNITITILGTGRWMGNEGRRDAGKNGWSSHWNQENHQLNWVLSNLMHLSQTR